MTYLAAIDFFRQVYLLLKEAVDSSSARWCLRLISFGTDLRDLDVVTVRELFPIRPLLTFSGIDDVQAQDEFPLIFVNLTGHAVYSMAELGIAFIHELIEIFFLEGTSEQKHQIFSILKNLVNLASREEFTELATPKILAAYFDHFMLMDLMMDERLSQSLAVYVVGLRCSAVRFESSGGLFKRY
jgi:hypothetical protein